MSDGALRVRVRHPRGNLGQVATEPQESVHRSLQVSSRSVKSLACIDVFDLDDTAFPLAYCVDRMHAKAAITNEPRHH